MRTHTILLLGSLTSMAGCVVDPPSAVVVRDDDARDDGARDDGALADGVDSLHGSGDRRVLDLDGDGYPRAIDCDDTNAAIYPGAAETWYDGIDQNCDGADDNDQDGDGHDATAYGGDDCDDTAAAAHPGGMEIWYDGIDEDCLGGLDNDADGDGVDDIDHGGADCDDAAATIYPGAAESLNDRDDDCNGHRDDLPAAALADAMYTGAAGWDNAGLSMARLDLDGDGTSDLVISRHNYSGRGGGRGAVSIDLDADATTGVSGLGSADVQLFAGSQDYYFGHAVAGGDLTGDGYDDLVVGAPRNYQGGSYAGAIYVIPGGPGTSWGASATGDTLKTTAGNSFLYGTTLEQAGWTLCVADLDGDGHADLVTGAPEADGGNGAVYLVPGGSLTGGSASLTSKASVRLSAPVAGGSFGSSLACAGDLSGDGLPDLVVGDPITGAAYIWRSDDAFAALWLTLTDGTAGSGFGTSVSTQGDLDRDGAADLLVGAPTASGTVASTGAVYGYRNVTLTGGVADMTMYGDATSDALGTTVTTLGDLTGDGFDDWAVGAPGVGSGAGAVYVASGMEVIFGRRATASAREELLGEAAGDGFGGGLLRGGDGTLYAAAPARSAASGEVYAVPLPIIAAPTLPSWASAGQAYVGPALEGEVPEGHFQAMAPNTGLYHRFIDLTGASWDTTYADSQADLTPDTVTLKGWVDQVTSPLSPTYGLPIMVTAFSWYQMDCATIEQQYVTDWDSTSPGFPSEAYTRMTEVLTGLEASAAPVVFFRPLHEPNGTWVPWGPQCGVGSTGVFQQAFTNVANLAHSLSPSGHVQVVLALTYDDGLPGTYADYVPAGGVTDVLAIDYYNGIEGSGGDRGGPAIDSHEALKVLGGGYASSEYADLHTLAASLGIPLMIAETGAHTRSDVIDSFEEPIDGIDRRYWLGSGTKAEATSWFSSAEATDGHRSLGLCFRKTGRAPSENWVDFKSYTFTPEDWSAVTDLDVSVKQLFSPDAPAAYPGAISLRLYDTDGRVSRQSLDIPDRGQPWDSLSAHGWTSLASFTTDAGFDPTRVNAYALSWEPTRLTAPGRRICVALDGLELVPVVASAAAQQIAFDAWSGEVLGPDATGRTLTDYLDQLQAVSFFMVDKMEGEEAGRRLFRPNNLSSYQGWLASGPYR